MEMLTLYLWLNMPADFLCHTDRWESVLFEVCSDSNRPGARHCARTVVPHSCTTCRVTGSSFYGPAKSYETRSCR